MKGERMLSTFLLQGYRKILVLVLEFKNVAVTNMYQQEIFSLHTEK